MLNKIFNQIGLSAILHLVVSYCICLTVALFSNVILGALFSATFGILKEISDHYEKDNHFNWIDLRNDAIGILLAVFVYVAVR